MTKIQDYVKHIIEDKKDAGNFSTEMLKKVAIEDLLVSGMVFDTNDSIRPFVEFVDATTLHKAEKTNTSGNNVYEYENIKNKSLFDVLSGRYIEGYNTTASKNKFQQFEKLLINASKRGGKAYNYGSFYEFVAPGNGEEKYEKTVNFYDEIVKEIRFARDEVPGVECVDKSGNHIIPALVTDNNFTAEIEISNQDLLIRGALSYFMQCCDAKKVLPKTDKEGRIIADRKGKEKTYEEPVYAELSKLQDREKIAVSTLATNLFLRVIAREGEEIEVDNLCEKLNGVLAYVINPRKEKTYSKEERKEAIVNPYFLEDERLFNLALGLVKDRVKMFNKTLHDLDRDSEQITVDLDKIRHDEGLKAALDNKANTLQDLPIDFNSKTETGDARQAKFAYINEQGHLLGVKDERFVCMKNAFNEINKFVLSGKKHDSVEDIYKALIIDFILLNYDKNTLTMPMKEMLNEALIIPIVQGNEKIENNEKVFNEAVREIVRQNSEKFYTLCSAVGLDKDQAQELQKQLKVMLDEKTANRAREAREAYENERILRERYPRAQEGIRALKEENAELIAGAPIINSDPKDLEKIEALEKDLNNAQDENKKLEEELKKIEETAAQLAEKSKQLKEQKKKLNKKIKKIKEEKKIEGSTVTVITKDGESFEATLGRK